MSKDRRNLLETAREVSFLPMEAIGEQGQLDLSATKDIEEVRNGYTLLFDGDVAVAKITPCFENGKGAFVSGLRNGLGFGTTELHVLTPGTEIEPRFLYYVTASEPFRRKGEAEMKGAAGQKRVPEDFIRDYRVEYPLREEQYAIANFLDRETSHIDALIAAKERLLELLAEKRRALITHAVTKGLNPNAPMRLPLRGDSGLPWLGEIPTNWNVARLKYVASVRGRLGFRGYTKEDIVGPEEGALVIGGKHIDKNNNLNLSDPEYISWEKFYESPEIVISKGDIVVAQRGSLGKLALIVNDLGPATINPSLVLLKEIKIESDFLFLYLDSDFTRKRIESLTAATAVPMISQEQIENIVVLVPPIDQQHEIVRSTVAAAEQIDGIAKATLESIRLLSERRSALIAAAVTGKIEIPAGGN